jgi:hypothetical protein
MFGSERGRLAHVEQGNHAALMVKAAAGDPQRKTKRSDLKNASLQKERKSVVQRDFEELTVGLGGLKVEDENAGARTAQTVQ